MVHIIACAALRALALAVSMGMGIALGFTQAANASVQFDADSALMQYIISYQTADRAGQYDVERMTAHQRQLRLLDPTVASIEIDPRRYRLTPERNQSTERMAQHRHFGGPLIQASKLSPFGTPQKVCIIDSGYDLGHPDLPGPNRVTGNALAGNGRWDKPGDSHGTHVAGVIAALDNGKDGVGVHSGLGLSLHIVKLFADDELWAYGSELISAIRSCEMSGANIISMSLGGDEPSSAERNAFATASANGVLLIAAAGNEGNTKCSYPACYESVVSVAAVTRTKQLAYFSQHNKQIELAAPGVNILSTVIGGGTDVWSGTSMATPHVSGAAALLWSLHPQCSNKAIRNALAHSAEDLGRPGRDADYGFGLVQVGDADQLLGRVGCNVTRP